MKYKIYKLEYKNEVIYVGVTINSLKRRKSGRYRNIPIEIKKESSIELIEETDDKSRERFWIKFYKDLGCSLYNKEKGSTGLTGSEYNKYSNKDRECYINDWREKNKDRVNQYKKKWLENNKEKRKEIIKKYREKKKLLQN